MKLVLDPTVKNFLKNNNILTEEDSINKMYEEFPTYPQKYTIVFTAITKNNKNLSVVYATNENKKDIDCLTVS